MLFKILQNDLLSVSRNKFHKARKRYSFLKNVENRKLMRESSKNYKTTLYNEYNIYQQKFADDLRKISKTDSKSFWKILNSIRDEKKMTVILIFI
jgi:hypothetical protein